MARTYNRLGIARDGTGMPTLRAARYQWRASLFSRRRRDDFTRERCDFQPLRTTADDDDGDEDAISDGVSSRSLARSLARACVTQSSRDCFGAAISHLLYLVYIEPAGLREEVS